MSRFRLRWLRQTAGSATGCPISVPRPDQDAVDLPLGLVALNRVRMYLPLVAAGLPRPPGNAGPDGLGFAKTGFRELLTSNVAAQALRVGARFVGARATAVARALGTR